MSLLRKTGLIGLSVVLLALISPTSSFAQNESKGVVLIQSLDYDFGGKDFQLPIGAHLPIYRESDRGHYCSFAGHIFWVYQKKLVSFEEAREVFDDLIENQPNQPGGYRGRASLKRELGDYTGALADQNKVISLSKPVLPFDFYIRGLIHQQMGTFDKALEDFREMVRGSRNTALHFLGYHHRGVVLWHMDKVNESLADFDECLRFNPRFSDCLRMKAWVMATHPNDKIRNSAKAIHLATKAFDLSHDKNEQFLETLAAAHAEAGDYFEAIKVLNKAIALSGKSTKTQTVMLEVFQQNKPFRQKQTGMGAQLSLAKP